MNTSLLRPWFEPGQFFWCAGPCSITSIEDLAALCRDDQLRAHINLWRLGIWKPRTRPGQFEGAGTSVLGEIKSLRREFPELRLATEVATPQQAELALEAGIEVLWIGARTCTDPFAVAELSRALASLGHPAVMVKNPLSLDVQLWRGAVERLLEHGNEPLALIHRGVSLGMRQVPGAPRYFPSHEMIDRMKEWFPGIPIFVDPSHLSGQREQVSYWLRYLTANPAVEGAMVEFHPDPSRALSDRQQQLTAEEFKQLLHEFEKVSPHPSHAKDTEQEIEKKRRYINDRDLRLLSLLLERIDLSHQVQALKQQLGRPAKDEQRWERLLEKLKATPFTHPKKNEVIDRCWSLLEELVLPPKI